MWKLFGAREPDYGKLAELIFETSLITSKRCCDSMKEFFLLEPKFDSATYGMRWNEVAPIVRPLGGLVKLWWLGVGKV